MRKRFKTTRICSSDNYKLSKKIHDKYVIMHSTIEYVAVHRYYIECFGKLVEIEKTEAMRLCQTVKVIIK